MSIKVEVLINPDELVEKCGCCFTDLSNFARTTTITDEFEKLFTDLIKSELISKSYSTSICGPCFDRLNQFSRFKVQLAENQEKLQESLSALGMNAVKIETPEEQIYVEEEYLEDYVVYEEEFVEYDDIIEEDPNSAFSTEVLMNIKSEEYFTCRHCNKTFNSRYRYRVHLKEQHPSRNENKLWVMSSHNDSGQRETVCSKEQCVICGKWITTSSIENHIKRMHSDDFRFFCDHCPQKFKVKRDIQYHVKKHMQQEYRERYQCEFCENSYLTMWALRHHFTMQHADINKDFVCDCGAAFKTKLRLNYHKKIVHNKGEYPCDICNKTYSSLPNLRLHNAQFHRKKDPCSICSKLVAPGVYMKRHMRTHEPAKFECPFEDCTKVFYGKVSLMDHQASFHGLGERIDCSYCGASFATKKILDKHVARTHTITERVPCEVPGCTHSSARKDYFISHIKTHKNISAELKAELIARVKQMKNLPW